MKAALTAIQIEYAGLAGFALSQLVITYNIALEKTNAQYLDNQLRSQEKRYRESVFILLSSWA
jgi:hypothetical protein